MTNRIENNTIEGAVYGTQLDLMEKSQAANLLLTFDKSFIHEYFVLYGASLTSAWYLEKVMVRLHSFSISCTRCNATFHSITTNHMKNHDLDLFNATNVDKKY